MKLLIALLFLALPGVPFEGPPWAEILVPQPGTRPDPFERVDWRSDLEGAIAEARSSGRPLFVTLRCLPCKQCAGFDQAVLEGGSDLDPLLSQFVTVRLTDARAIDLRVFPVEGFQDLDLSWWGWFLSPELNVYGIFGGKDHRSDATRISPQALVTTLERVLEHHYDPRRSDWNERWELDGPAGDLGVERTTPLDLPGFASWEEHAKITDCLHCHQVAEILRQPAIAAGTFDKQLDLGIWPLPENVGITVERDDGLLVTAVGKNSPAARAGITAGDRLAVAGGRRLFGQADLRGALHRGPRAAGKIDVHWWRGDELKRGSLEVEPGWRVTRLSWRVSISQGNIGAHPGFAWARGASSAERRRSGIPQGSMALKPSFGREASLNISWQAGLREDDLIVAVDGKSPDLYGREFMSWFRMLHEPGDTVTLTLRDKRGSEREISYELH